MKELRAQVLQTCCFLIPYWFEWLGQSVLFLRSKSDNFKDSLRIVFFLSLKLDSLGVLGLHYCFKESL